MIIRLSQANVEDAATTMIENESVCTIPSGSCAVFPSQHRLEGFSESAISPLRLELNPKVGTRHTQFTMTLAALPVDFVRSDGTQTGYSVACFEANFVLKAAGGRVTVKPTKQRAIEYTGTKETEREGGLEARPKVEAKFGTEGAGVGGELVAYTRRTAVRDVSTARSSSADPLTKCIVIEDGSRAHWTMTPSPVVTGSQALRHSETVSGVVDWQGPRAGEVQVWGRSYAFCRGTEALSGAGQLKAKFVHWWKALKVYDDRRPERFIIVEAAA